LGVREHKHASRPPSHVASWLTPATKSISPAAAEVADSGGDDSKILSLFREWWRPNGGGPTEF
jgi:hypothetical protein